MRCLAKAKHFKVQSFLIILVLIYSCISVFAQSEANHSAIQSSKEKAKRIAQPSVWRVGILKVV